MDKQTNKYFNHIKDKHSKKVPFSQVGVHLKRVVKNEGGLHPPACGGGFHGDDWKLPVVVHNAVVSIACPLLWASLFEGINSEIPGSVAQAGSHVSVKRSWFWLLFFRLRKKIDPGRFFFCISPILCLCLISVNLI